jgi:hypothetical protein
MGTKPGQVRRASSSEVHSVGVEWAARGSGGARWTVGTPVTVKPFLWLRLPRSTRGDGGGGRCFGVPFGEL